MRERAAKEQPKEKPKEGGETMNKKARNAVVQQERRRMKSVAMLSAKDADSDEETPGETENKLAGKEGKKEVVGLNG